MKKVICQASKKASCRRNRTYGVMLLALLAIQFGISNAAAQEVNTGVEVFASIGGGYYDVYDGVMFFFSPAKHAYQTGLDVGGGVAYRPVKRGEGYRTGFGFEFEINTMRKQRGNEKPRVTFYTGNVLYHLLGRRRIQPYVLIGAGGVRYERFNRVALTAGGGGKFFLTPHISIRPEIRAFASWDHSFLRYSGGIAYHW
jgi:hypothetical protein